MNYSDALAYLDGFVNLERNTLNRDARAVISLDRVHAMAARLGHPQKQFASVHVAGTKGKGSTCAFAESILRAAGMKTGLYTSPHLHDVRERIQVDGQWISETDFARLLTQMQPVLEELRNPPQGERRPTYFEILTHLAFLYFAEQKVDIAVLEVGLGGRLDATNIVTPLACAITSISLDHQAILGETLEEIAREKAGIFKPGVLAIVANQRAKALDALDAIAGNLGVPLLQLGQSVRATSNPDGRASVVMSLQDGRSFSATLALRGLHQAENWALGVHLADNAHRILREKPLPPEAVTAGSRDLNWPGRLEETERNGVRVFFDGAHNDHSLATVLAQLSQLTNAMPLAVVFGCAKDKNIDTMLEVLRGFQEVSVVIFTQADHSRAANPSSLMEKFKELTSRPSSAMENCQTALESALKLARSVNGAVLVTGSLYLVGALRRSEQLQSSTGLRTASDP